MPTESTKTRRATEGRDDAQYPFSHRRMRVLSTKPVATPATKDKVAILAHVESDTIAQRRPRVGCADAVG